MNPHPSSERFELSLCSDVMSAPPSPSDSVLRDRALRSASLARERARREAREPSFDSRIEEGELLSIPSRHDDDAVAVGHRRTWIIAFAIVTRLLIRLPV